jgi:TatD DNase family protein
VTPFDTHAHIHDHAFDSDRSETLDRAWSAGLTNIVTVGTDIKESMKAVELARDEPLVFATAGIHPHDADSVSPDTLEELASLATQPKVVAIGEIGLDFYRMLSPREAQEQAFWSQLSLARVLGLPVVIHSRDAHEETYAILSEWAADRRASDGPTGVLHCFSGDLDLAERYVALGFLISIAGPVTYPKNLALQQVAAELPLEHLVAETDCPYLSPQTRRGKRNEPANVVETIGRVAELRGMPVQDVAAATTSNAQRLFRIEPKRDHVAVAQGRTVGL